MLSVSAVRFKRSHQQAELWLHGSAEKQATPFGEMVGRGKDYVFVFA